MTAGPPRPMMPSAHLTGGATRKGAHLAGAGNKQKVCHNEKGCTMQNTVTRRDLVAGTVAVASAAAAAAMLREPRPALAAEDVAWDEECEVLVVGSGYAGLAAAYEAKIAGADVKIIEKLGILGGNSIAADGDFAVCGSEAQKAAGVEDSIDTYVHDMQVAGLFLNDVEKCRIIAEKSNETWEWTRDVLGVEWQTDETGNVKVIPYGGHSVLRTVHAVIGHGSAMVLPLAEKLEELGVPVECERMLVALVKNAEGRVVGAEVHDGAKKNDPSTGEPRFIKATRGVVLASGGFGRDIAWRMQHDPRLDESVDCTNAAGATAEAICAACDAGALPVHLDWIQCGPWCSPDEVGYGTAPSWIDSVAGYAPDFNPLTGRRCVNELTDRKRYCDIIFEVGEPLVQVVNDANVPDWSRMYLEACVEAGVCKVYDNLEDIADDFGLPKEAYLEQMAEYNGYVEAKCDEQFGKTIPADALPIDEPPFYVTRRWPKVHHTMGGVKTDAACHVIDMHLQPIPGLFAAGEVTGGVHGACRLGSCATADCLVNGRIAGQMAAAEEPVA